MCTYGGRAVATQVITLRIMKHNKVVWNMLGAILIFAMFFFNFRGGDAIATRKVRVF